MLLFRFPKVVSVVPKGLPYILLFLFFAQVVSSIPHLSLTADEPVHMAQGYVYWTRGDFRFAWAVAQPPLPDILPGAGLLLQPGPAVEELDGWAEGDHSRFVSAFLRWYGPGPALEAATFVSRFPITLTALVGAAFVYRWARERFGRRGGWLALFLFAFDPNFLAHSGLATTDVLLAVWGFVGVYAATRWVATYSWKWGLLSGVALGLALGSKTSGFFPFGIVGLLMFTWALEEFRRRRNIGIWLRWAGRLVFLTGLAIFILWALYGFEIRPYPFATHLLLWQMLRKHAAEGHSAFLMGQVGQYGWWYYYPVAFLLKTPLPTLFLLGTALFVPPYSLRRWWRERDLWLYPLLYGIATLFSTIAIGYRYLLPALLFLFVLAGRSLQITEYAIRNMYCVLRIPFFVILAVWLAFGTMRIAPHYLAFFNELAGGPYGGHRYLVDSNLDWGQSFKALQVWLQEQGEAAAEPHISFYTYAGPDLYGVAYRPIPPAPHTPLTFPSRFNPMPGLYVIGATTLQGVMLNDPDTYDWFRHREPIARPGIALFVYRVLPHDQVPTWLAQCTAPVAPLSLEAAADGFGRDDLRLAYFDCTSGWLYPTGGGEPGWFAFFRQTALADDPFIRRRLSLARLSFEQRRTGSLPPFAIYEQPAGRVGPRLTSVPPAKVGALTFLGSDFQGSLSARPGATVDIETWWQVGVVPDRPLSIMMHLVGPGGQPVIIGDGLAVPVDQWRPGDIIVQRHRLPIPADAPSGEYQPFTGVYWLDTMERWSVTVDEKPAGDQIPLPVIAVSRSRK